MFPSATTHQVIWRTKHEDCKWTKGECDVNYVIEILLVLSLVSNAVFAGVLARSMNRCEKSERQFRRLIKHHANLVAELRSIAIDEEAIEL